MKEQIFVVFSNRYDFENDGQIIKGSNVHYVAKGQDDLADTGTGYGKKLNKLTMDYRNCELFNQGTGIYEIEYTAGLATRGKPLVTNATLVKRVDIDSLFNTNSKVNAG